MTSGSFAQRNWSTRSRDPNARPPTPQGFGAMAALLILRDRVVRPLLAAASRSEPAPQPRNATVVDLQYAALYTPRCRTSSATSESPHDTNIVNSFTM